jgi:hypothetical protein
MIFTCSHLEKVDIIILSHINYIKLNTAMTQIMSIGNELADLSEKLSGCFGTGICDEKIHKTLSTLTFKNYEKIFNLLTNQISIKSINPTYSLYKASLFTGQASHHINISSDIGDMYYTTIQSDDKCLFLHCLSPESLVLFLMENSGNTTTYISIPVIFSSEIHKQGHFCILVFNIITREVFFVDPNGRSSFFDNIFYLEGEKSGLSSITAQYNYLEDLHVDSEEMIENMLKLYISDVNTIFDTTYKFIERTQWNPYELTINKDHDASLIKSGHCVCIGTLIANYICVTKESPADVFAKFANMEQYEILELINSYSVGMYELLQSIK